MLSLIRSADDAFRSSLEAHMTALSSSYQTFDATSSNSNSNVEDKERQRMSSTNSNDNRQTCIGSKLSSSKPTSRSIHTQQVLEKELKQALQGISKGNGELSQKIPSYPIASAVGRATFAAFGLAAKVTSNLMEATLETMESGSGDYGQSQIQDQGQQQGQRQGRRSVSTASQDGNFRKSQIEVDSDDEHI
jgi:hypothetical protein